MKKLLRAMILTMLTLGASAASAQTGDTTESTSTTTGTSEPTTTTTSTTTSADEPTTTTHTATHVAPTSTTSSSATTSPTATTTGAPAGTGTAAAPAEPVHEEEHEGDGRDVDFIWIEAFGGIANVNLVAFGGTASETDPSSGTEVFHPVSGTGPMFGGALGFRVWWLAIGARTTFASYDAFQIGTIGGEAQLRLPIPVVEPYIRAGFGYAWQGNATYSVSSAGVSEQHATTVYGWAFNAAVGFDIFLVNWFTIGAGVGLDVLNMARQTDPRAACMGVTDFCPGHAGDAVGYQLSGYGQIGFHI